MSQVTAIPHLDLNRYLGRWYEICRLPMKWEDEAATDITAHYSINDAGKVRVDNRCFDGEQQPAQAIGEASAVDESNSKLKVTFLPKALRWLPFTDGDYWVLKIDEEYRTALVGSPDGKYLWVLSREPHVDRDVVSEYLATARTMGFDLSPLITPLHTGREVTDEMVEA